MAKLAQMSDFSFTLPDEPGALARFTASLQAGGVNLVGLWGYAGGGGTGGGARFYCVPESGEAFRAFATQAGVDAKEGTTFYLTGADQIGALVTTLGKIADAGVNLHAIQSTSFGGDYGCFLWADPDDWPALARL